MRRIVIFGAAERLGSVVSEEALSRGHVVVGVVREGNQAPPGSIEEVGDATTPSDVQTLAPGADALVCVVGGPDKTVYLSAARTLVEMVAGLRAPAPRILHSGGGGSLLDADGVRFVDAPGFSPTIRAEALGQAAALDFYRTSAGVTWTYMSLPQETSSPDSALAITEPVQTIRSSPRTAPMASHTRTTRWRWSTRSRSRPTSTGGSPLATDPSSPGGRGAQRLTVDT